MCAYHPSPQKHRKQLPMCTALFMRVRLEYILLKNCSRYYRTPRPCPEGKYSLLSIVMHDGSVVVSLYFIIIHVGQVETLVCTLVLVTGIAGFEPRVRHLLFYISFFLKPSLCNHMT